MSAPPTRGQAVTADRRYQQTATVRAVTTTSTKAMKKARATMARVTRGMMETSPREEGDNGHNNQLGTKMAATVRTVVTSNRRQCKMGGSGNHDGW
jgi:hypothetical protein